MRFTKSFALTSLSLLLVACTASGGGGPTGGPAASSSPSTQPSAVASSQASASPSPSLPSPGPDAQGPWLRAWVTQALPPQNVFALSDALVITAGGIAVPEPTTISLLALAGLVFWQRRRA